MKLLNFNIIKLTLALISGIGIAHYFNINSRLAWPLTLALILIVAVYWFKIKNTIHRHPIFGILIYLCFLCIGANTYNLKDEKQHSDHYTNLNLGPELHRIELQISERLKPDTYNAKYIARVIGIDDVKSQGRLLINVSKDFSRTSFGIDDKIIAVTSLNDIQKPLNPHQFDYSNYLQLRHVFGQLYLNSKNYKVIDSSKQTIYGYSDFLRYTINRNLIEAGFKDDVLSIINALLLGQRQNIDKSIYNNYVNSGTIHILAVSGLHVGILLWILNFILRPILFLKYGRIIRPLIIVLLLWCFAIIAGLSPSVTRAVTMFSIISIAMHFKRPTNIYNTLFISAFIILLFKPRFLFEVGFQLSYLAVFGIVSIQPLIYKLWKPKFLIIDKFWQIFTVTIAAQIGVLPISLFYFHQFPGLFFVSNLIVIPFLSLILGFGLLIIILALLNWLTPIIVDTYSTIIELLNDFIAWIAQYEEFLFRDIPFRLFEVILTYLVIVAFVQTIRTKAVKWFSICLIGVITFQVSFITKKYLTKDEALIIFNKSRHTLIGQKSNSRLVLHHNLDVEKRNIDNTISNYMVGEEISEVVEDHIQNIYQFNKRRILVVDSIGVYNNISFKPDYILLINSPKLNLNRLIDSIKPKLIIADASNYKSYIHRWQKASLDKKIHFHYTNEKGAFILK
ncbi:ComEC/Rec2 family competence protein [Winogradskyella poriferorum]|uniref:ComEC/Rec2 family competence protein n=1 Tax=Winogradskyella poriferorum TaxID=307627 RepID=UPI003D648E6D